MNTKKIFASFIFTYIMIVILTMLCLAPVFLSAVNSSKKLASQTLLDYAEQSVSEYTLTETYLLQSARRFYTDDTLKDIYYGCLSATEQETFYQMNLLQKTLKLHFLNAGYLKDVIVYIPKYDYVLTTNYIFRSREEFYSYIQFEMFLDKEDWLSEKWSYSGFQYYSTVLDNRLSGEQETDCMIQIMSFPMAGDSKIPVTMLLCLDSESVAKSLLFPEVADRSYAMVQDASGQTFMWYGPKGIRREEAIDSDSFTRLAMKGPRNMTITLGIDAGFFQTVQAEAFQSIGASILGALLVGAAVSFFLSKRHLRPIKNSIEAIREYQTKENFLQDSLEENIANTVKELQKSYSDMDQLDRQIRKDLLERAFFGGIESSSLKESFGIMYGEMPVEAVAAVIGFIPWSQVPDASHFFDSWLLPKFQAAQVTVYIGLLQGSQYFLVLEYQGELEEKLSMILEESARETSIVAKAGLSNRISGLSSIEYGIRHAQRRLEAGIEYEGMFVFQHTLKAAGNREFVTVSQLNVLHSMLLIGQAESADSLISSLFEDVSGGSWNSVELRQLFFSLRSVYAALISHFREQSEKNTQDPQEWPVLPKDLEDNSPDKLKEFCLSLNHTLKDCYHQNLKRVKRDKGEEVVSFVAEQFRDMNLCAGTIADHFGLSEKYIFQLVKDASGKTLNSLITELRIKEAIRLLENTEKTIGDIAVESGFSSSNSMYKVFIRTQGVSPSSYREKKGAT